MSICEFCGKTNFKQFKNHVRQCPKNPSAKASHKGFKGANQFSTGRAVTHSDETKKKLSESSKKFNQHFWTDHQKRMHSELMKKVVEDNPDSYSHLRGGKRKYGEYFVDSQWEIDAIKYFEFHQILFERKCGFFQYYFDGSERKYFPDFYLPSYDVYVEVKGYKTEKDSAKWSQFPKTLKIIDVSVIQEIQNLSLNKEFFKK